MNSLGKGLSANRRTANPPLQFRGRDNPRNENAVRSASVKPLNPGIPISNAYHNIYRNTMNNVDWKKDEEDRKRGEKISQVAEFRRKDKLKPQPVLTNLRGLSDVNMGRVEITSGAY